ncbi:mRNA transport regulator MTR10 [Rhodotorula toruloides]|nr:mRNA transport regulator MTR10 [Rhodotorula toruloides]
MVVRTTMADASLQAVVEALNILYTNPDREAKEKANAWLGEFQKSITYDLATLPQEQLIPLRDSLLTALRSFASGPRVVLTQICIALADIALQLTKAQWDDPVASMIEMFGKEPAMAAALLEFFQVLAEEYNSNYKINVNNDLGREGDATVKRGEQVIGLLSMYVQAPGITAGLHNQCFATLGAWLRTGQIRAGSLAGTPVLASAFSSLSNDQLFDNAVDVLVDIIHETQELQENIAIIQEIMPRLTALGANLANEDTREDDDKMRGYCRIFVEAGEWYEPLIVQHPDTFLPLVELIKQCAAYDGLDVVGITLNFWYRLSQGIHRAGPNPSMAPLLQVFADLVGIVIRHLHFPDDSTPLTGEERDTFRDFRHKIGDTLKDCCKVLGAGPCLQQAYDVIARAVAAGDAVRWQDVEAPLFSMRSMGAMIDVHDNELVPKIMELLPKLPQHPRIRYAAILVIGRYTHWTQQHPDLIQFQLPYVSAGFDDTDPEVLAAASQTMKYLCKDCPEHLVAFLPQLHTFIQTVSSKLKGEDLLDLCAAIAHILIAMPPSQIPSALSTFLMPNVEIVHALVSQDAPAAKDQIRKAVEALERIDVYLAIIGHIPDGLPDSCLATCQQVWSVMDALIAKYGSNPAVADRATIALRRGLVFFDEMAFAVAPAILDRLSSAFEQAPASGYLWITGKVVQQFAPRQDAGFDAVVKSAFERESNKVFELLQSTPPSQIPDVLDDYVHLVQALIESAPQHIFTSPAFPAAFQCTLTALTLPSPRIVLAALDAVRAVVGHDSLHPETNGSFASPSHQAAFPTYATAIRAIIESTATQLIQLLLDVLVGGGEDEPYNVLTILRLLSIQFPTVLAQTVPAAVELLPARAAGPADKAEFLAKFNGAITAQNPNQVKEAFTWLLRASRRSRDRARPLEDRRPHKSSWSPPPFIYLGSLVGSAPSPRHFARSLKRSDWLSRARNMCEECCTAIWWSWLPFCKGPDWTCGPMFTSLYILSTALYACATLETYMSPPSSHD